MEVVKRVLLVVFLVLYLLCVGSCIWLLVRYTDLRSRYDGLLARESQRSEQLARQESELDRLREEAARLRQETETAAEETEPVQLQTELQALMPGDILPASAAGGYDAYFSSSAIVPGDAVYQRIIGKSYPEGCSVALEDLRYLRLLHYNFQHEIQAGEMIVSAALADTVLQIFRELFESGYEIQSVYLVDRYWTGDAVSTDSASIEQNNTSCFNYREATNSASLSKHAYGCAIDINPQQNPYVWYGEDGSPQWSHSNADAYIDRSSGLAHMISEEDICYLTFVKYGFSWGGSWGNPKDYQHFEIEPA